MLFKHFWFSYFRRHGTTTFCATILSLLICFMANWNPGLCARHVVMKVLDLIHSRTCRYLSLWKTLQGSKLPVSSPESFSTIFFYFTKNCILVIRQDGSIPVKYGLILDMDSKVSELRPALSKLSRVNAKNIVLAEVNDGRIEVCYNLAYQIIKNYL